MSKNSKLVILLSKNKIDFYSDQTKKILRLSLPPQVYNDLEIVNEDLAENQISGFITTNKIIPSECLVILSDSVLFQKDFPPSQPGASPNQKEGIENYVKNIPFEDTTIKTYPLPKGGIRVVAANKSVYDVLIKILGKNSITSRGVAPLLDFVGDNAEDLTQPVISKILKHFDSLKGDQFVDPENPTGTVEKNVYEETEQEYESASIKNKKGRKLNQRAIVLIIIFVILLMVLFGLIVKTVILPDKNSSSPSQLPVEQAENTPTPTVTAVPMKENKEDISIEIITVNSSLSESQSLRDLLNESGFGNTTITIQEKPSGSNNFVVYSENVSPNLKNEVQSISENIFETIASRVSSDTSSDVIFTIIE